MRRLTFLLAALLSCLAPSVAEAVYACGGRADTCPCGANNPYPCCDNDGNCTWYAWHAMCCNWGVGTGNWGNANQWRGNAAARGFRIIGCGAPTAGTVANRVAGQYGHVAWTAGVNGNGTIYVEEQSCQVGYGPVKGANYWPCWFDGGFIATPGYGECNPGDWQTQGCGLCGTQGRGCTSDGRWGGWGACTGQGECSPGQVDTQGCCDCGTRSRRCNGACRWDGFSACAGPDPAGAPGCDTGEKGVCADGQKRCVDGCLSCVRLHAPSPETCDDRDNDCDGETDEGRPPTIGDVPPAYAATVTDVAYPRTLACGALDEAWVTVRNDGRSVWKTGEVALRADELQLGHRSDLAPERGWPAHDTVAVVDRDLAPGESIVLRFPIRAGATVRDVSETFTMTSPAGRAIACPDPGFELTIALQEPPPAPAPAPPSDRSSDGCGTLPVGLAALAGLAIRRRR